MSRPSSSELAHGAATEAGIRPGRTPGPTGSGPRAFGPLVRTLAFVAVMLHTALTPAQINTTITPSGLGTTVAPPPAGGTNYQITGGTRQGPNLFHSFGLFSVGAGDVATFNNETGLPTSNILGRITGGQTSNIFGTIRTTDFGAANLFLINPSGWIFGPTASLEVGGSFHVSTADYLRFSDGAKFYADLSQNSVLTSAPPVAFGFLGPAAPISVEGSFLQVPEGQTLSLVAGDVQITGAATLLAPSGRVQIGSFAAEGEATVDGLNGAFANLGRIEISGFASIDASGVPTFDADGNLLGGTPGGTVLIRGGRLIVDSSAFFADTWGDADGARLGIDLRAREAIVLANGAFAGTQTFGSGRAGDISLSARTVTLTGGAAIRSQGGRGPGGDTTVTATASIDISGRDSEGIEPSQIVTEIRGEGIGKGGRITLSAPSVALADGGSVFSNAREGRGGDIVIDKVGRLSVTGGSQIATNTTSSDAQGGNVTVTADSVALSGAGTSILSVNLCNFNCESSRTRGGDISMNVGTLTLGGGAQIQSGAFVTDLKSGNVDIRARDSVVIFDGGGISSHALNEKAGPVAISAPIVAMSNGFIDTGTFGGGDAGDVSVTGKKLTLANGARIGSSSELASTGHGGDIRVTTNDSVSISGSNSGLFSTAAGAGPGGNISITTGRIQLLDGATISSSSTGTVNALAGTVNIVAGELLRMVDSSITTESIVADGGNISIKTTGSLVHLTNSQIATSVQSGLGAGGNITIGSAHPIDFLILNNSGIHANAFGGPGGNINISANTFLSSLPITSAVTASSALSSPGTIDIQAFVTDVSERVVHLPDAILQAATLLRASCAARVAEGKSSSLVLAARDGLPLEPGSLLPSPLYFTADSAVGLGGHRPSVKKPVASHSQLAMFESSRARVQLSRGWDQFHAAKTALGFACSQ